MVVRHAKETKLDTQETHTRTYKIQGVFLEFSAGKPFINYVHDLLSAFRADSTEKPDIRIRERYNPLKPEAEKYVFAGKHITISQSELIQKGTYLDVRVNYVEPLSLDLCFNHKLPNKLRSSIVTGDTRELAYASFFSYSLFWPLLHRALLKNNSTFLHAGTVSYKDDGIAFVGPGGSGKTTLAMQVAQLPGGLYLSDDFGILSTDGKLYRTPRLISFYRSDLKRAPKEQRKRFAGVMRKSALRTRLSWWGNSLIGRNPIRRLHPEELFGKEKIASEAVLRKAYFLVRSSGTQVVKSSLSKEHFCERSKHVALREFQGLYEQFHQAGAASMASFFDIEKISQLTRAAYMEGLDRAETYLLEVPANVPFDKVMSVIGD